eukprot:CAMPEP_0172679864 /NCGR_PEP_ID=MMETSP1074-20121228/16363_1 /TAXON_ID=2916 /ORGANISM="Ceratium fusus, Strain PA161109" /LENGTH=37 /DNA_ID= /DNA_START= /DNA_END= /DNA_ORIENTATION=
MVNVQLCVPKCNYLQLNVPSFVAARQQLELEAHKPAA